MTAQCNRLPNEILDYKQMSKIKRVPIGNIPDFAHTYKKEMMTMEEVNMLLDGHVIIEEKLDGSPKIRRTYDEKYILFGENMRYTHSIHYTHLPNFFIVYDVLDSRSFCWLRRSEKVNVCETYGFTPCPILHEGDEVTIEWIEKTFVKNPPKSHYSDAIIEGIVIKNIDKGLFGKVVNREFMEGVHDAEHWRNQPRIENYLKLI